MIALADAFIIIGLGCLWTGLLVYANGGLPRQLQSGETQTAEKGSQIAFMLFWMDQYRWFGIILISIGIVLPALGLLGVV